jgi:hypothetical protein
MQNTNSSFGIFSLQVTFAIGSDPNINQVDVQSRAQLTMRACRPRRSRRG